MQEKDICFPTKVNLTTTYETGSIPIPTRDVLICSTEVALSSESHRWLL
jgi:hypothetical protein